MLLGGKPSLPGLHLCCDLNLHHCTSYLVQLKLGNALMNTLIIVSGNKEDFRLYSL